MMHTTNKNKKEDKYKVGTIDGNDLLLNREGKVNKGEYAHLRTKVHKSKRDYDRQRNRKIAKDAMEKY